MELTWTVHCRQPFCVKTGRRFSSHWSLSESAKPRVASRAWRLIPKNMQGRCCWGNRNTVFKSCEVLTDSPWQNTWQKHLKEGRIILSHSLRGHSPSWWRRFCSMRGRRQVPLHPRSESREMNVRVLLAFRFHSVPSSHGMALVTRRVGPPVPVNQF